MGVTRLKFFRIKPAVDKTINIYQHLVSLDDGKILTFTKVSGGASQEV